VGEGGGGVGGGGGGENRKRVEGQKTSFSCSCCGGVSIIIRAHKPISSGYVSNISVFGCVIFWDGGDRQACIFHAFIQPLGRSSLSHTASTLSSTSKTICASRSLASTLLRVGSPTTKQPPNWSTPLPILPAHTDEVVGGGPRTCLAAFICLPACLPACLFGCLDSSSHHSPPFFHPIPIAR
jgi:hypothetical protein